MIHFKESPVPYGEDSTSNLGEGEGHGLKKTEIGQLVANDAVCAAIPAASDLSARFGVAKRTLPLPSDTSAV
jgi:hypothetical protein